MSRRRPRRGEQAAAWHHRCRDECAYRGARARLATRFRLRAHPLVGPPARPLVLLASKVVAAYLHPDFEHTSGARLPRSTSYRDSPTP